MPPAAAALGAVLAPVVAGVVPIVAGVGSTAAGIASTVGATAAAVPGIVTGAAGKIAAGVVPAVTGLGKAIPAAVGKGSGVVGGVSGLVKALEPAAELFGAGVGVYSAVKGIGQKEKALDIAAQQAANQKKALELQALQDERIYAPDLIYGAPQQPIESVIRIMQPLDEEKAGLAKPQIQDQLATYAPLILIGILGFVLVRKIWK